MCFRCMCSSGSDDGQQAETRNPMHLMSEFTIERRMALASNYSCYLEQFYHGLVVEAGLAVERGRVCMLEFKVITGNAV